MATHSSTLAWKIPWIEEPGRLQSVGSREQDTTERFSSSGHDRMNDVTEHFHELESQ